MSEDTPINLPPLERRELDVHGRRLVVHVGGPQDGRAPALLLIHGITSSASTWRRAVRYLCETHTVIAPDLPGHGESENPPGDYSLGAYAASMRDVLALLDVPRVTLVGHSLGGGIALQSAYLFPELVERLVLVSSGGLGPDVHLLLRAATLPGAELVLPLLTAARVLDAGDAVGRAVNRVGVVVPPRIAEIWQGLRNLQAPQARRAFVHTARAVIGPAGQRVSAVDRLYLAELVPSLLLWGTRDRIIPVTHAEATLERMPGSRLEVFERSGHFPHESEPRRFARVLAEFVASTEPADVGPASVALARDRTGADPA